MYWNATAILKTSSKCKQTNENRVLKDLTGLVDFHCFVAKQNSGKFGTCTGVADYIGTALKKTDSRLESYL